MTGKDKHMPLYSSSDIEKYLSGDLSDPEMHAMERAALDDPFLADALEGMIVHRSLSDQPSFQQDMAILEKRLHDRVAGRKIRVIPLAMRYAAVVILLLGIGVTTWYILTDKKMRSAPLAASKVEVPTTAQPPAPESPSGQASVPAAAATDSTSLAMADGRQAAPREKKSASQIGSSDKGTVDKEAADNEVYKHYGEGRPGIKKDTIRLLKKDVSASYGFSSSSKADKAISSNYSSNLTNADELPAAPLANNSFNNLPGRILRNNQRSILYDSVFPHGNNQPLLSNGIASGLAVQRESDMDTMMIFKPNQLVYTGQVLNQQNLPLPGATLSYKKGNYNFNTVTDANGYFTLTLPKLDTTSKIVAVNYIGYEPVYAKLNTDDKADNTILLKRQSASLNEVVVVGYGTKRKELTRTDINSVPPPLSQIAVPAKGWPSYNLYLESNKNSAQIDTTIRGYESISFIVNDKGELSRFRVERSLSPAHDSLAIRLIKEGPSWMLLKGKKEKARVVLTW
jgi:hypothetical protein